MIEFDFGPRHRVVTKTAPQFFWLRVLVLLAAFLAAVVCLLAVTGLLAPAHAGSLDDLKRSILTANRQCGSPATPAACGLRDSLLRELKTHGVCFNDRAGTEAGYWVPCDMPAAKPLLTTSLDAALSQCMRQAVKADQITAMRDRMIPAEILINSGQYPADMVRAIYSGRAYSYNGAAYCYSAENIMRLRALGAS